MNVFDYSAWNRQEYRLSAIQENMELVAYSLACFLVPFLIGHPQLAVGVVVNAALVLAALNLRSKAVLPVILLPSVGVLARGLVFGPFTAFLVYMVPFIWAGNAILVWAFKNLYLEGRMGRLTTLFTGSVLKTLFLFTSAFILVSAGILPEAFLAAMGVMQFTTAMIGGFLALSGHNVKKAILS